LLPVIAVVRPQAGDGCVMIYYDTSGWGVALIFQITGSVFPRAVAWSVPSAALAVVLNIFCKGALAMDNVVVMWSGYTAVLGFLMVFRNNQAYHRFWEGAALTQQVRGEWLNAVSSLMAFCNDDDERRSDVVRFSHFLIRLMSMLHCAALQQIACVEDNRFEIINPEGISSESLKYLSEHDPEVRCEIVLLWIQRLIVVSHADETLKVPPPILTRAFQELSRGIVTLHDAQRIKEVPFPFPYSQLITLMLLVHWLATPILSSQVVGGPLWAGAVTFCIVSAFWALLYIALDIEQPFGEDDNKLPVAEMQRSMNESLSLFLEDELRSPPTFSYSKRRATIRFEKSSTMVVQGFSSNPTIDGAAESSDDECDTESSEDEDPTTRNDRKWGSLHRCSMTDVSDALGVAPRRVSEVNGGSNRRSSRTSANGNDESRPVRLTERADSSDGKRCVHFAKNGAFAVAPVVAGTTAPPILKLPATAPPDDPTEFVAVFPSHQYTNAPVPGHEAEKADSAEHGRTEPIDGAWSDRLGCTVHAGNCVTASDVPAVALDLPHQALPPGNPGDMC